VDIADEAMAVILPDKGLIDHRTSRATVLMSTSPSFNFPRPEWRATDFKFQFSVFGISAFLFRTQA